MQRSSLFTAALLAAVAVAAAAPRVHAGPPDPAEVFHGVLSPDGLEFETHELAPGVYALMANKTFVTNSGFVVGDHGVLVIDTHVTAQRQRSKSARTTPPRH
jgi:hypothetical protein